MKGKMRVKTMRRFLVVLFILAAVGGCSKPAEAPEPAKPVSEGLAPGTMEVVSVEPVELLPLSEVNLLSGGDFSTWRFGTPKPAGFTLPNEQFSAVTREGAQDTSVVFAKQTWQQADTAEAMVDQFRAELPGTEAGVSYRLEVDASGMGHVGLWEAVETGTPQPLDLDFIVTQPSQDVVKRYARTFVPRVGGTVVVASRSQMQPAKDHAVMWSEWRVTKASPSEPTPPAAPAPVAGEPAPGTEQTFVGIPFVWCPPGSAVQGTADASHVVAELGGREEWYGDETPVRVLTFDTGFWVSKTEVTATQWEDIMKSGTAVDAAAGSLPKTGISWDDCAKFTEALNQLNEGKFALPTESQWEYACRAGTSGFYYFGDDPAQLGDHAWLRSNVADGALQAVGQKKPNAWGACDMLGNAWELCADNYGSYSQTAPRAIVVLRTIRGGSVASTEPLARCAYRAGIMQSAMSPRVGVRIVREP